MSILQILQHSLGVDKYGRGEMYRNHFVTGEGTVDFPLCMEAVERGLMRRHAGNQLTGEYDAFTVTPEGKQWVLENSPAAPKLTRAQRRYQAFLDHDCSLSFGEWLKSYGKSAA